MEITNEKLLDIVNTMSYIRDIINNRLEQFSDKYGEIETCEEFGSVYCNDDLCISIGGVTKFYISWYHKNHEIGEYPETIKCNFPAEYLDDTIWEKFFTGHQERIDYRNKIEQSLQTIAIKKEILRKKQELDDLEKSLEIGNENDSPLNS